MVWSDQTQFPFYVVDNNGNTILTIDETGLHLTGPLGEIDGIVSGAGYPMFQFHDAGAAFDYADLGFISVSGGTQNGIRLALWDTSGGTPVNKGQLLIDSQGNCYFYGSQDINIQSDTNIHLFQTNGPHLDLGGAEIRFTHGNDFVAYNAGSNALIRYVGNVAMSATACTPQNGWSGTLSVEQTAERWAVLNGSLTAGTIADGTVIALIPSGFAPVSASTLRPSVNTGNANSRIVANPNGTITCFGMSAGVITGMTGLQWKV